MLTEYADILRDSEVTADKLAKLGHIRERAYELGVDGNRTDRDFELAINLSCMLTVAAALF